MSDSLRVLREFLRPGSAQSQAIQPLDGPWTPNSLLDAADLVSGALPDVPDDLVWDEAAARCYVSAGPRVLGFELDGSSPDGMPVAEFPGAVTGIALLPSGDLLACVSGAGLMAVPAAGGTPRLVADRVGDTELRCLTSVVADEEGTVYVANGSRSHVPQEWIYDLFDKASTGAVFRLSPDGQGEKLASDLAYPSGLAVDRKRGALLVSEAWRHRVVAIPLRRQAGSAVTTVLDKLAAYPGRIKPRGGQYVMSLFAVRTHLIEFVLRENAFRTEMMRTIHPDYWIRPALATLNSGLEPLQGGSIKKLGEMKPWAPPRSYGLVVSLDDDFRPEQSWHSRADGNTHGIQAAVIAAGALLATSASRRAVVRVNLHA